VYNLMLDKSVTVAVQKWGRPLRKYAKKTSVDIVNFVSFPKKVIAGKSVRETLSDHSNSLLASMIMGSNLTGGLLADMSKFSAEDQHKIMEIEKEYIQDVSAAMLKDKMDLEDAEGFEGLDEESGSAVKKLQKKTTDKLMALTMPPSDMLRLQGFDRINQMADSFMAGTIGKEHMAQIRELMEDSYKTVAEWVPVAEKLAKENGGVIPNGGWLRHNNYAGLYQAMIKNPSAFIHFKQESKKGKTTEQWVPVAEKLAKENGGVIPNRGWLKHNGYIGLYEAMKKKPQTFSHLKQESKKGKTAEQWVSVAEKLAKKKGGLLPNVGWLVKNGFYGLHQAMKKKPQTFSHLKQVQLKKAA
jgi:hypothetical protein